MPTQWATAQVRRSGGGGSRVPSRKRTAYLSDDEGDLGGDLGYTYVRVRGWLSTLMLGT